jgi:hypothetical protein
LAGQLPPANGEGERELERGRGRERESTALNSLDTVDSPEVEVEVLGKVNKYSLLSKANGNLDDYDHNGLLVSKFCPEDHFPTVLDWVWAGRDK